MAGWEYYWRAAGYAHAYFFDDLEDFATQAEEIFGQDGPVLVWVKVIPNVRPTSERAAGRGAAPPRRAPQAIKELKEEFAAGNRR